MRHSLYVLCFLLFVKVGFAFNPSWTLVLGYGFEEPIFGVDGVSLWGRPHEAMSKAGISSRYMPYFGIEKATKSMDKARQEIIEGTKIVDEHNEPGGEAELDEAHCDDESLDRCHGRLVKAQDQILAFLQDGQVSQAREKLGRVLHTLQDFYSHSNWVELGFTDISKSLGKHDKTSLELPTAPLSQKTCQDCTYPGVPGPYVDFERWFDEACRDLAVGSDPLSTPNKGLVFACMKAPVVSAAVIEVFLRIYHPASAPLFAELTEPLQHLDPDCSANLLPGRYLTTGYFGTKKKLHSDKPAGKCSHGGPFDRDATGREGICKDTSSPFMSPHHFNHKKAAALADAATIEYLDDVKNTICGDTEPSKCALLKLLYGVGPTLSFAIDTTGSMGPVIAAVQDAAVKIVNDRRDDPINAPSLYVLAPFNDPDVPAASTFTDPDAFIAAILSLYASGGDDCPELAMQGLSNAVGATNSWGQVFLWTDAAAKDAGLAGGVASAAKEKNIQVNVFLIEGCSTTEGFQTVVDATKGKIYTNLDYASAAGTAELATTLIDQNINDIVDIEVPASSTFPLGRRQVAREPFEYDVPIDSTVDRAGFSVNSSEVTLTISRPDGGVVASGDDGVTFINLATGLSVIIDNPVIGVYSVVIEGDAAFSFSVFGRSPLNFAKFDFVEWGGGLHDGWFKTREEPLGGQPIVGNAIIEGDYRSVQFDFRSRAGDTLGAIDMVSGPGGDDPFQAPTNYHLGNLTVPRTGFNIYATGLDTKGAVFQRLIPGLPSVVPGNFTEPPPGNGSTSTSTSFSVTPSMTSTWATSVTATSTENTTVVTSSGNLNSTATYSNTTLTTSAHSATLTTGNVGATLTTAVTHLSTVCPLCQPTPTPDASVTTLTRTIVYYSPCPYETDGTTSTSTAEVTTTLCVPCYGSCPSSLPVICPGCESGPPGDLGYDSDSDSGSESSHCPGCGSGDAPPEITGSGGNYSETLTVNATSTPSVSHVPTASASRWTGSLSMGLFFSAAAMAGYFL